MIDNIKKSFVRNGVVKQFKQPNASKEVEEAVVVLERVHRKRYIYYFHNFYRVFAVSCGEIANCLYFHRVSTVW